MPHGSLLGLQLFLLCTVEHLSMLENTLYGYADDSTFLARMPSQLGTRVAVIEILNRDLNRVSM